MIYGMTSGSLEYRLNKTRAEANAIAQKYWDAFPRIQPWLAETINEVKRNGYVTYWSGRRWYEEQPDLFYKGANADIQGGSHDAMMVAVTRVCDFLDQHYPEIKLVSLVHDEIDLEMSEELLAEVVPQLQSIVEIPDLFDIPFFTDVKVGKNYSRMEEWRAT